MTIVQRKPKPAEQKPKSVEQQKPKSVEKKGGKKDGANVETTPEMPSE